MSDIVKYVIENHMKSEQSKSNLILVGMSGAGKSTVGALLAEALGLEFLDIDQVIREITGRELQEIIDTDGNDAFLEIEEQAACGLDVKNCVIATGGSVVYSEAAMDALKQDGVVLYLNVPFSELEQRLTDISQRGIVIKEGFTIKDVYLEREPLYQKYCDICLTSSDTDIQECISAIIEELAARVAKMLNSPLPK